MEHVHEMKERLAQELSNHCEKGLHSNFGYMDMKCILKISETINALHTSCHIMHKMKEHSDKAIEEHYR